MLMYHSGELLLSRRAPITLVLFNLYNREGVQSPRVDVFGIGDFNITFQEIIAASGVAGLDLPRSTMDIPDPLGLHLRDLLDLEVLLLRLRAW